MRGSDPDASVYYLAAMLEGGEDARFIARRMIVLASEDIGNADPRALLVAVAAAQAVEHVGLPEARLNLVAGRDLPRPRAEVERLLRGDQRGDRGRARARPGAPAGRAARRALPRREEARPRRRATSTRTTTRAGLRSTTSRKQLQGQDLLPAVRIGRRGGTRWRLSGQPTRRGREIYAAAQAGSTSAAVRSRGQEVTFASRFEESGGKTSPEELIAAAHATCFSMALANGLAQDGHAADAARDRRGCDARPDRRRLSHHDDCGSRSAARWTGSTRRRSGRRPRRRRKAARCRTRSPTASRSRSTRRLA